jgi:hypothetical protein
VGAPGGTSGNFQSQARTISLQDAVFPAALATGAQQKKKKKKKKKRRRMWYINVLRITHHLFLSWAT